MRFAQSAKGSSLQTALYQLMPSAADDQPEHSSNDLIQMIAGTIDRWNSQLETFKLKAIQGFRATATGLPIQFEQLESTDRVQFDLFTRPKKVVFL